MTNINADTFRIYTELVVATLEAELQEDAPETVVTATGNVFSQHWMVPGDDRLHSRMWVQVRTSDSFSHTAWYGMLNLSQRRETALRMAESLDDIVAEDE